MRTRAGALCVLCVWSCVSSLGCGSSDGDAGGCTAVKACGGDLLGTWKLTSACNLVSSTPAMLEDCPEASSITTVDEATGKVIFDKDTYSREIRYQARVQLRLPDSCKSKLGVELCSDLSGPLDDGTSLECSVQSGGGCSCEAAVVNSATESGVYTVRGTRVELTQGTEEDFCVQKNQLEMSPRMTMSMGDAGEVTFLLRSTLTKQ